MHKDLRKQVEALEKLSLSKEEFYDRLLEKVSAKYHEADEAKSNFISVMSHEIRTPLNSVIGMTNLLLLEENLTENQRRYLNVLKFSSEHLMMFVNDILEFGKPGEKPDKSELLKNTRSKTKLLIVEDNPINQLVASKFLEKWGYSFEIAENGHEAITRIAEEHFDLILMDIQMPVMNGYETARKIRSLQGGRYNKIPIIALTANVMSEVRQKAITAGMNDFLSKPFSPADLLNKITQNLKQPYKVTEPSINRESI